MTLVVGDHQAVKVMANQLVNHPGSARHRRKVPEVLAHLQRKLEADLGHLPKKAEADLGHLQPVKIKADLARLQQKVGVDLGHHSKRVQGADLVLRQKQADLGHLRQQVGDLARQTGVKRPFMMKIRLHHHRPKWPLLIWPLLRRPFRPSLRRE